MSIELVGILIAILAVGATLAGMILAGSRGLRQDMVRLESRLDAKIDGLDAKIDGLDVRMREDMKQLSDRLGRVEHSQAKLEGLLEGLREAITGRAAAG